MGVEEEPLDRLTVTEGFARDFIARGGSPSTVGATSGRRSGVYYNGADVLITAQKFVRRRELPSNSTSSGWGAEPGVTSTSSTWLIDGMRDVRIVREHERRRGLVLAASAVPAAAVFYTFIVWKHWWLLIAAFAVQAAAAWAVRPRRVWELRATYRGADLLLLRTSDAAVLNKVTRALRRAVEARQFPGE